MIGIPSCAIHTPQPCNVSVENNDPTFHRGGSFGGCIDLVSLYRDSDRRVVGRTFLREDNPSPVYMFRANDGRISLRQFNCREFWPGAKRGGFFREAKQRAGSVVNDSSFGAPTTTEFDTDLKDDWLLDKSVSPAIKVGCWVDREIRFITGPNRNQWRTIVDQQINAASGTATIQVDTPLSFAPQVGDTFIIQRVRRTPIRGRVPTRLDAQLASQEVQAPSYDGRPIRYFETYRFELERDSIVGSVIPGTAVWDPRGSTPPAFGEKTAIPDQWFDLVYDISESFPMHMPALHLFDDPDQPIFAFDHYTRVITPAQLNSGDANGCFIEHNQSLGISWYLAGVDFRFTTQPWALLFDDPVHGMVQGVTPEVGATIWFVAYDGMGNVKEFPDNPAATSVAVGWGTGGVSGASSGQGNPSMNTQGNARQPTTKRYESPCTLLGDVFFDGFDPLVTENAILYTCRGKVT